MGESPLSATGGSWSGGALEGSAPPVWSPDRDLPHAATPSASAAASTHGPALPAPRPAPAGRRARSAAPSRALLRALLFPGREAVQRLERRQRVHVQAVQ